MKYLLFSLLFFISIEAFEYETDYKKSLQKAKAEKKEVMLVMTSDKCPWCDKLKSDTLEDKYVGEFLKTNYVSVIVDKDSDKYPKSFSVEFTPTIYFFNPYDEDDFYKSVGYKDADTFLKELKDIKF